MLFESEAYSVTSSVNVEICDGIVPVIKLYRSSLPKKSESMRERGAHDQHSLKNPALNEIGGVDFMV